MGERKFDEEIILDICELLLQLVENEIETAPFKNDIIFDWHTEDDIRELFKKHISKNVEKEIRNSRYYLNLKRVLMSDDNKKRAKETIWVFQEALEKSGLAMDKDDEGLTSYLERYLAKHMKRK